ncbi:TetR family transcriptional regulator [Lentzea flaviverrucosa]|uniref:Transcriptional regulator, TetR family n=1 Tax=Lentzea flaviverrucosa TaxID=200379 RepID=A0A1H9XZ03_9PSEU|nr:TetR family transcriptional regulator [Lentzea flaviverrucosa]RDI27931.1 TetR family transcriptional regulator [Lentzea flaviverrucosa]SES50913.1 transcriptional regulator, TetR family [Lentzea flaviverrucosa]
MAEALTGEAILAATEEVLRRYGPAKATVVDVAKALGVSHGSVYRHFPTKAALREAVTRRWLDAIHLEMESVLDAGASAADNLRAWLQHLFDRKRLSHVDEPELFATFKVLVSESRIIPEYHLGHLVGQIARIISAGVETREFVTDDVQRTAQAVWDATQMFHHPAHAQEWGNPHIQEEFDAVVSLVVAGLRYNRTPSATGDA